VDVALRYIYGIGPTRARETVGALDLDGGRKVRDLTEEEIVKIRDWIDRTYKVEGDLRRDVAQDIKRKIEIGSYQGVRHRRSLPVRGQRTHTNARTRKGPKKTVGVKRKKGK
jgi:small subunit ribosomal protein S13